MKVSWNVYIAYVSNGGVGKHFLWRATLKTFVGTGARIYLLKLQFSFENVN